MKKIGKTNRPFRYDPNQIPYDYTVEVMNKFKGLVLVDSAWRTMAGGPQHFTGRGDQNHPKEKGMQEGKVLVWGGFTNRWEKKRS